MAPPFPQIIPDNAFLPSQDDPGFQREFDSTVGNAATNSDGFDLLFLQVAGDLASVPDLISSLDPDILEMSNAFPDLATPWEGDFSNALASAITSGDPDFKQYDVDLTGNTPPASGGGGGGSVTCEFSCNLKGASPNAAVPHLLLTVRNNDTRPRKVASITLDQDTAGVFAISHDCPATLGVGHSCTVTVKVVAQDVGAYHATIAVEFGDPSDVSHACLLYSVTKNGTTATWDCQSTSGGGGGGTGGGGGGGGGRRQVIERA